MKHCLFFVGKVCTFIPFVMKLKSEFRARINSLERLADYTRLDQVTFL